MNKRILVVDVRPDILDMVKEILEEAGYEALLRQTPFQNAGEIEALHPDLILLAVLNVVDCIGKQILKMLKHHSIPILVLVPGARYSPEPYRELMSEHTTFIPGPFYIDDLTNAVHQALRG